MKKRPRQHSYRKPDLTVAQILNWADDYHRRTGTWPNRRSSGVPLRDDSWRNIDEALFRGYRGLPPGSSLPKLLFQERGVMGLSHRPKLGEAEIVRWSIAYFQRTGEWPTRLSKGPINEAPCFTWCSVDYALRKGGLGSSGGSSLAMLLADHNQQRYLKRLPPVTTDQVLKWADAYYKRHGTWPNRNSGTIDESSRRPERPAGNVVPSSPEFLKETWRGIDVALRNGNRGLPGGSSLPTLLSEHRGVINPRNRPNLSQRDIIRWAREHFQRTGRWPKMATSDPIDGAPNESWNSLDAALRGGRRGLPGKSSLANLLSAANMKPHPRKLPKLNARQILSWADEFHVNHGSWPDRASGVVDTASTTTWMMIDNALRHGLRGLPGGSSLPAFLNKHRGIFNGKSRRPKPIRDSERLSTDEILRWGAAYRQRDGLWPNRDSGLVRGGHGLTWSAVDSALKAGNRGLPGGSSLCQLFRERSDCVVI